MDHCDQSEKVLSEVKRSAGRNLLPEFIAAEASSIVHPPVVVCDEPPAAWILSESQKLAELSQTYTQVSSMIPVEAMSLEDMHCMVPAIVMPSSLQNPVQPAAVGGSTVDVLTPQQRMARAIQKKREQETMDARVSRLCSKFHFLNNKT